MNLRSLTLFKIPLILTVSLTILGLILARVSAQDPIRETAFTFQGRLTDGGEPANDIYDLQFFLYTDSEDGTQVGSVVTLEDQPVSDSLFSAALDFGEIFKGTILYLETGVRKGNETGPYTILSPRQPLRPVPYALALPGLYTQQNPTSVNLIGGYSGNEVTDGVVGATIGGGGRSGAINQIVLDYGTVSGGRSNIARGDAATISGGYDNLARETGATVGGGGQNKAENSEATVAGGFSNAATGLRSTVGGGEANTASNDWTTVSGGNGNIASGIRSAIGGGYSNLASGGAATVGGGGLNTAANFDATVAGGISNTASGVRAAVSGEKRTLPVVTGPQSVEVGTTRPVARDRLSPGAVG